MTTPSPAAPFLIATLAIGSGLNLFATTAAAQTVSDHIVETHANDVPGPVWLSFAPDGTLFAGHDPNPNGSGNPRHISRIAIGGSPVTPWGSAPTPDPDSVAVDTKGLISGFPGSVLVGGIKNTSPLTGSISAIHPDQTVVELWSSTQWNNPSEMVVDHLGRLIFTEVGSRRLLVSHAGETPSLLTQFPAGIAPSHLAIAPDNRIYVGDMVGGIHIVDEDGTIRQSPFATLPARPAITFGPDRGNGAPLYAMTVTLGELFVVEDDGNAVRIGSGFTHNPVDLATGPDGRLYISHTTGARITVISSDRIFQDDFEP